MRTRIDVNDATHFVLSHGCGIVGTTLVLRVVVRLFMGNAEWLDLLPFWAGFLNLWIALPLARHSNNKG